jgi:hypothetical protein
VVGDRSADRWPEGDERRVVRSPADAIPIARRWYEPTQRDRVEENRR